MSELNCIYSLFMLTCPSVEAEKNSVPDLEFIHNTLRVGSLCDVANELSSTGSEPLLVSQNATCPLYMPLTRLCGSLGLYSRQQRGTLGCSTSSGLLGFSVIQFKLL